MEGRCVASDLWCAVIFVNGPYHTGPGDFKIYVQALLVGAQLDPRELKYSVIKLHFLKLTLVLVRCRKSRIIENVRTSRFSPLD